MNTIKIGDSFDSINSKCENKLELEEHYPGYSEEPDGSKVKKGAKSYDFMV